VCEKRMSRRNRPSGPPTLLIAPLVDLAGASGESTIDIQ
jgi:hypothetical protein